jgi:hypothetical protein
MKGLSICLSVALLFLAQQLAGYLKRARAHANLCRLPPEMSLSSNRVPEYDFAQWHARPGMIPPALPVRAGEKPYGPDIFSDFWRP